TEEAFAAAEQAMGVTLPEDMRACYRVHDGQQQILVNVTYAQNLRCIPYFLYGDEWLSLEGIVRTWQMMKGLLDDGAFDGIRSEPRGPIRADWWHPAWVPVTDDTTGYMKCLDLAPTSLEAVGQVISWCHDDATRTVRAKSFTEWLNAFAGEL